MTHSPDVNAAGPREPRKSKPGRKAKQASAFDIVDDRRFTVTFGGTPRKLDAAQALKQRTLQDAFTGNIRSITEVLKWIEEREAVFPESRPNSPTFKFQCRNPRHVDEALRILGIVTAVPGQRHSDDRAFLELEPEFVRLAIARMPAKSIVNKFIKEIAAQTRDADSVCWPEYDA